MAGGHFRAACEITLKRGRECEWTKGGRRRVTEGETSSSVGGGEWLELGMWFIPHCLGISIRPWSDRRESAVLDTRTYSTGINPQIQSALLAALEILVEGNVFLRNNSAVMFEILFPYFQLCVIFSGLLLSVTTSVWVPGWSMEQAWD